MKKAFSVYAIAYAVLLLFVLGLLYTYPKQELHLLLNSCHTKLQDTFFTYYTMLAEWPIYALALLPLLLKHVKLTIFYAVCELTGGAVLQALKYFFDMPRPAVVFQNYPDGVLPVVEGIDMHTSNSFPSGHAFTFFVFCTCCALYLAYRHQCKTCQGKPTTKFLYSGTLLLLLSLAALGAYSRVYLSQHFLSDVCVGSIIGFVTPCLMFYLFRSKLV